MSNSLCPVPQCTVCTGLCLAADEEHQAAVAAAVPAADQPGSNALQGSSSYVFWDAGEDDAAKKKVAGKGKGKLSDLD